MTDGRRAPSEPGSSAAYGYPLAGLPPPPGFSSGYSSTSSSPSFGAVRFTGPAAAAASAAAAVAAARPGTLSAGPSPSMGPRRYTGIPTSSPNGVVGYASGYASGGSAAASPPFHPPRYTGSSAGPSPMSGPVRMTGLGSASASMYASSQAGFPGLAAPHQQYGTVQGGPPSIASLASASASASGTSVQSFGASAAGGATGRNSNASSSSSPPPASNSSFAARGEEAEWTEYLNNNNSTSSATASVVPSMHSSIVLPGHHEGGELRGRQRALDKARELLRERSGSSHGHAQGYVGGGAGTSTRNITPEDLQQLLESRAQTPDSEELGWHDASFPPGKAPVQAYEHQQQPSVLFSAIFFLPLQLARVLRWLAGLSAPRLLFVLAATVVVVAGLVAGIKHALDPDKEPKPWRLDCAKQPAFPHELADSLAPVDVFVGVFSRDASAERRSLIRHTYAAHTLPLSPHDGTPMANVQVKFILGRPRGKYARSVRLEQEMYNDIVILDTDENMNKGKTLEYFRWAAANATVPVVVADPLDSESEENDADATPRVDPDSVARNVRWKMADYVVKADDDAFIVLSELERHLRLQPRNKLYWGCESHP